jgi:hypothetical protein
MRSLGLIATGFGLALLGSSPLLAAPAAPASAAAAAKAQPAVAPEALQALQRMSGYLKSLPALEVTSKTSLDVVTTNGERIQLDGIANYKVRRPNAFRIEVDSDKKKRTFFYNGKQFTVYAPELGYYATAPAPATIRETLNTIENRFGIQLPLQDLFRWNDPTGNPAENLTSGFVVGTATLDGVETDQYAFRQAKVDWQIWIQRGPHPLPLKVVIVDKVDPANPAYIARLAWNVSPNLNANDFTFQPGKDAKHIHLAGLTR